jgi:hypothetical protein
MLLKNQLEPLIEIGQSRTVGSEEVSGIDKSAKLPRHQCLSLVDLLSQNPLHKNTGQELTSLTSSAWLQTSVGVS